MGSPMYYESKAQPNDDWICDGRCFLPSCASTCRDRGFHGDSKYKDLVVKLREIESETSNISEKTK
ncbi:hypothetical protein QJS10_CPB14g01380 [Acorus calamus]|uniref:Uncharacterized protein n=1 Tax=Acorus calamus TaxID=4465 RepID=A0AAV9DAU9_ACOCL|nr:hypothetical protein QJS10_CPB14g01380 [Acorus calamus]